MPLEEQTYRKRVDDRMERFEKDMRESQTRQEIKLDTIDKKVSYTNGKVRKIVIALVLVAGVVLGQSFPSVHDIIRVLAPAI